MREKCEMCETVCTRQYVRASMCEMCEIVFVVTERGFPQHRGSRERGSNTGKRRELLLIQVLVVKTVKPQIPVKKVPHRGMPLGI